MTIWLMLGAVAVAGTLSQGRYRYAAAGMLLPAVLVVTAHELPIWAGEGAVGVVFAIATGCAWAGVIPAPVGTQVGNAIGSGLAVGASLVGARLASELTPIAGSVVLAVLLYGVEVAGSRANPFGEWGSLAHNQARLGWALTIARFGPHAVTLGLVFVSGAFGFASTTGTPGPLLIGLGAVVMAATTMHRHLNTPSSTVPTHRVVGLIESDQHLFSATVSGFVGQTRTDDDWTVFNERSRTRLRQLLDQSRGWAGALFGCWDDVVLSV